MTATGPPIIRCPVCDAHGDMLRHDRRATLIYSCQRCLHEWEIDPADEPPQEDTIATERPQTPAAHGRPPRN
jgi:hypothetical protein